MDDSKSELEQSQAVIQEMRKRATASNYKYSTLQREFLLYPEVFNPHINTEISKFINMSFYKLATEEAAKKSQHESVDFMEVGCGAGYTAISLALLSDKCHVWATDINQAAVKNSQENTKLHDVENRFHVVLADVFDHEEITGRKFDMIYWNHPWGGHGTTAGTEIEPMLHGIVDPGYQGLHSYLSKGEEHLKESGRLILAFSFSYGSEEKFAQIAKETGWSFKIIEKEKFCLEIDGKPIEHSANIIEMIKGVK